MTGWSTIMRHGAAEAALLALRCAENAGQGGVLADLSLVGITRNSIDRAQPKLKSRRQTHFTRIGVRRKAVLVVTVDIVSVYGAPRVIHDDESRRDRDSVASRVHGL